MLGPKSENSISDGDGNTQVGHNSGTVNVGGITFEQHVAQLEKRLAEKTADLERAYDAEKQLLVTQVSFLESQLANPEASLREAKKRISELEALLEGDGNQIGSVRIGEARAAMIDGDYSVADDIFAEVEERQKLEVQQAARAAFGRGEIAEVEIRWHDAAKHYVRAARLDPSFDTLHKARKFSWLSGDAAQAFRWGEELIEAAKKDADEKNISAALNEHAGSLHALGRYEEAESLFREALAIGEKTIGVKHPDYAKLLNNLAMVVEAQGRYEEAEGLYREALAIDEKTIGVEHPEYAKHLNNLAAVVEAQGRYEEAEGLFRKALAIGEKTIGVEHPNYAIRLNNLAGVAKAQGRYEEAEGLYREALAIDEQTIGVEHPDYAIDLNNLALVVKAQGRYEEAEGLYREAMTITGQSVGMEHPSYAIRLTNLAGVLKQKGEMAEAREMFEQALAIFKSTLPADHPHIAVVQGHIDSFNRP